MAGTGGNTPLINTGGGGLPVATKLLVMVTGGGVLPSSRTCLSCSPSGSRSKAEAEKESIILYVLGMRKAVGVGSVQQLGAIKAEIYILARPLHNCNLVSMP